MKDRTSFEHQHDLTYYGNSTEPFCCDNYVGETGCRVIERIKDFSSRDNASAEIIVAAEIMLHIR